MSQVSNSPRSNSESKHQRRSVTNPLALQVLLALIFLFTGSMKLILPIEALTAQLPLPGLFVRFIGVAEVAGALGLILPGSAYSTGTDAFGRLWAGDHHDWGGCGDSGDWWWCYRAGAAGGRITGGGGCLWAAVLGMRVGSE